MAELFTPVQGTILDAAGRCPGCYLRSGLAKFLVGSRSSATAGLTGDPDFGRLAGQGRKAITFEIDTLLQQGYLALDYKQRVVPGPNFPTD